MMSFDRILVAKSFAKFTLYVPVLRVLVTPVRLVKLSLKLLL